MTETKMNFGIVKPGEDYADIEFHDGIEAAKAAAGLDAVGTDHGIFAPGVGIIVYEFGLFGDGPYFTNHRGLVYAGNAVLYGFDPHKGETVSLESMPEITIHGSVTALETAIHQGKAVRPRIAIGSKEIWRWPDPAPEDMQRGWPD